MLAYAISTLPNLTPRVWSAVQFLQRERREVLSEYFGADTSVEPTASIFSVKE
jgi:hypothetical protein